MELKFKVQPFQTSAVEAVVGCFAGQPMGQGLRYALDPGRVITPNMHHAMAKNGAVKHLYFIAETKGSMSSMELRKIEESKIACARRFFAKITSDQVKYDVVDSYGKLMELVK